MTPKFVGSLWMLVAGLLFGCMSVFVKLGASYFTHIELVFYRSFISMLIVYAIMRRNNIGIATQYPLTHFWRGLSGTIALLLFFYCITVLPLATAVTLNYTAPLFLTLFTMMVYKDKFHLPMTIAITLGFCGVVLLLHPTLEQEQLFPGLLGLVSGFLAGIAYLNVKQLGIFGEPAPRIVFYFSLFATFGSGIWMMLDAIHIISLKSMAMLLGLGMSATLAQIAMTYAHRVGHTMVVSNLSYSTIVFSSLFGMMIWHELLPLSSWLGMAFIIIGGVLSLRLIPKHEEEQIK